MSQEYTTPKPGSWANGPAFDIDAEVIKVRAEEDLASNTRASLIEELLEKGTINSQYADLLRGLSTVTVGAEGATLRKVQAVMAARELFGNSGVQQKRAAYIGSGTDWRFPVALGARDIVMVDSDYKEGSTTRQILITDIMDYDPKAVVETGESGSRIRFVVDVGKGSESVVMQLDSSDVSEYQSSVPLGLVLEFAGPSKGPNRSRVPVIGNIAQGMANDGLVFNLDYNDDVLYTPKIGMRDIQLGQFHVYQVSDRDKMIEASKEEFKPPEPRLSVLRKISASRRLDGGLR